MTEIPGTTTLKQNIEDKIVQIEKSIKLESVIDVRAIKKSKLKVSALDFDNQSFKNWVVVTTLLVSIFIVYLCFTSIKFIILIFSGPGIGVVSYYFKEKLINHFHENDQFIKRHVKFW